MRKGARKVHSMLEYQVKHKFAELIASHNSTTTLWFRQSSQLPSLMENGNV